MFTDRFWILKTLVTLSLIGWLCTTSRRVLSELHPDLERAALYTDSLRDRTMATFTKKVVARDGDAFLIDTHVGPMRVITAHPPKPGETVTAQVRAVGPRTFEVLTLHVNAGHDWKRPLNYGISILTVIVYLWLIRGRFRWRIEDGVFRSRY